MRLRASRGVRRTLARLMDDSGVMRAAHALVWGSLTSARASCDWLRAGVRSCVRAPARFAPLLLLAGSATLVTGCGLGPGAPVGGVKVLVTKEFGEQTVASLANPKVAGTETVMSLLMRNMHITTRYGGGFVESIDGDSGGVEHGKPFDWFYYVNGVEASKGAAEVDVKQGEQIWWDLHDWGEAEHTPAVVGSYPEPFLNGLEGRRLPVRLECADPQKGPCRTVTQRLAKLGVPAGVGAIGPLGESEDTLSVLVGTYGELRRVPAAHLLEGGPGASGVYVRVLGAGRSFALLDAEGSAEKVISGDAGLIAATRYPDEGPTWIVTGADAAGVLAAADHLDEATLERHFAVAIEGAAEGHGERVLPLPLRRG